MGITGISNAQTNRSERFDRLGGQLIPRARQPSSVQELAFFIHM